MPTRRTDWKILRAFGERMASTYLQTLIRLRRMQIENDAVALSVDTFARTVHDDVMRLGQLQMC